jgi:hypothetical protein
MTAIATVTGTLIVGAATRDVGTTIVAVLCLAAIDVVTDLVVWGELERSDDR